MDKRAVKKKFREVMMHTPVEVHKAMTREKMRRLGVHLMAESDLRVCEENEGAREKIVWEYKERFPKQTRKLHAKMAEVFEKNPRVKNLPNKDAIRTEMEYCWFGYGFHPDEYFFLDLGGLNKSVDRRRALVSEQERVIFRFSVNDFTESILSDKAEAFERFHKYYKRTGICIDQHTKYEDYLKFIEGKTEFVQKYVSSSRGQAVKLIYAADIRDKKAYFDGLCQKGKYLLEEKIIQSEQLNVFGSAIQNIRVSTFNTRHGIKAVCGFFTMSRKGTFVVNATIGCVFAAIDCETGEICSDGCDEYGNRFEIHPDYGVKIRGFRLPEWDEAIALCKEIASQMPNIKYISFDLAHTTKGWDVIEMNPSGQFLHQAGTLEGFKDELKGLIKDMDQLVPYAFERR